ncbi:MAG: LEA type 2 family protein [Bacteroidetes bacterium]|nr:LEA type 2 family protein [Bacteroidota bacterium]
MFKYLSFIVVVIFFISCKPLKEAEFTGIKNFKINKINQSGIDADVAIGIKNPNNIGFNVYPSNFNVVISGVNLGTAHSTKRVKIKAKTEKEYNFHLKSDFKSVSLTDILKMLGGGLNFGNIEVKGYVKIGKFLIRKKVPINAKERMLNLHE